MQWFAGRRARGFCVLSQSRKVETQRVDAAPKNAKTPARIMRLSGGLVCEVELRARAIIARLMLGLTGYAAGAKRADNPKHPRWSHAANAPSLLFMTIRLVLCVEIVKPHDAASDSGLIKYFPARTCAAKRGRSSWCILCDKLRHGCAGTAALPSQNTRDVQAQRPAGDRIPCGSARRHLVVGRGEERDDRRRYGVDEDIRPAGSAASASAMPLRRIAGV
jgi:hypothetical protein